MKPEKNSNPLKEKGKGKMDIQKMINQQIATKSEEQWVLSVGKGFDNYSGYSHHEYLKDFPWVLTPDKSEAKIFPSHQAVLNSGHYYSPQEDRSHWGCEQIND